MVLGDPLVASSLPTEPFTSMPLSYKSCIALSTFLPGSGLVQLPGVSRIDLYHISLYTIIRVNRIFVSGRIDANSEVETRL